MLTVGDSSSATGAGILTNSLTQWKAITRSTVLRSFRECSSGSWPDTSKSLSLPAVVRQRASVQCAKISHAVSFGPASLTDTQVLRKNNWLRSSRASRETFLHSTPVWLTTGQSSVKAKTASRWTLHVGASSASRRTVVIRVTAVLLKKSLRATKARLSTMNTSEAPSFLPSVVRE